MADSQLDTLALVTGCNMGTIELLLGQVAMQAPVDNKAVLTKEEDMGEFFRRLELEENPAKCRILLDEDLVLRAGESKWPRVNLVGGCSEEVVMGAKKYTKRQSIMALPGAVMACNKPNYVCVVHLSGPDVIWKKGRLISRADLCRADSEAKNKVNVFSISQDESSALNNVYVGDVKVECKRQLFQLLQGYSGCFSHGDDNVGLTHLGDMQIRLTTDVPVYYRPYRLSLAERQIINVARGRRYQRIGVDVRKSYCVDSQKDWRCEVMC